MRVQIYKMVSKPLHHKIFMGRTALCSHSPLRFRHLAKLDKTMLSNQHIFAFEYKGPDPVDILGETTLLDH